MNDFLEVEKLLLILAGNIEAIRALQRMNRDITGVVGRLVFPEEGGADTHYFVVKNKDVVKAFKVRRSDIGTVGVSVMSEVREEGPNE